MINPAVARPLESSSFLPITPNIIAIGPSIIPAKNIPIIAKIRDKIPYIFPIIHITSIILIRFVSTRLFNFYIKINSDKKYYDIAMSGLSPQQQEDVAAYNTFTNVDNIDGIDLEHPDIQTLVDRATALGIQGYRVDDVGKLQVLPISGEMGGELGSGNKGDWIPASIFKKRWLPSIEAHNEKLSELVGTLKHNNAMKAQVKEDNKAFTKKWDKPRQGSKYSYVKPALRLAIKRAAAEVTGVKVDGLKDSALEFYVDFLEDNGLIEAMQISSKTRVEQILLETKAKLLEFGIPGEDVSPGEKDDHSVRTIKSDASKYSNLTGK